jgi:hypothetical protein
MIRLSEVLVVSVVIASVQSPSFAQEVAMKLRDVDRTEATSC